MLGNGQSTQNFAFSKFLAHAKKNVEKTSCHARGSSQLSGFAAIHFRNFVVQWHHLNVFDLEKIRIFEMNLQISRKSTLNTQKMSSPDRPIDDQITLDTVLLYKLTSPATAVILTSAEDMHRWELFPSRQSTRIHPYSKLPPSAPNACGNCFTKRAPKQSLNRIAMSAKQVQFATTTTTALKIRKRFHTT